MKKKIKQKKENKPDLVYFVIFIPVLVVFAIVSLLLLDKVARNNGKLCRYLGKNWLEGSPTDPSVRRGCFTYEELYSGE